MPLHDADWEADRVNNATVVIQSGLFFFLLVFCEILVIEPPPTLLAQKGGYGILK